MSTDILIKNGIVIDGTGKPPFKADLIIKNERIENIGNFKDVQATKIIDARDLTVAPGFIDVHNHLDFIFPSPRHPEILKGWIYQGVTTIVSGNCGISPAPIKHVDLKDTIRFWGNLMPREGLEFEWTTMAEYLDYLENVGQAFNVAILTGHNTLRTFVMGFQARFAKTEEIDEMKNLLRESIQAGSMGLSIGLAYIPSIFSNTDELIQLASVLTEFDPPPPIVPHVRGMFTKFYDKAIEEVIKVAEINKIPLQISHHAGGGLSRARKRAIKAINEAIERGVEIGHDNIPWPTRRTTVLKIFPAWLFDGGLDKFFERLQDSEIRKQAVDEIMNYVSKWPPWENRYWLEKDFNLQIQINGFKKDKNLKLNNMKLKDIAIELNKKPIDALIDLVLDESGDLFFLSGRPDDPMAEDYMIRLFKDPNCSVGTDIVGIDFNSPCPGAYGGFTKILGNFVRERGELSLEDAVYKMTSLPAKQMQLKDRGIIEKGKFADITIFNPKTIKALASFKDPHQLSVGVEYVLINGNVILEKGNYYSNKLAGKVIRRD